MNQISWQDFEKVELVAGTIIQVDEFPEAKKPAYKLLIDLGSYGVKKSSAQITNYTQEELVNKKVICVVNFPPRQIGPFMSEVLTTGFEGLNGEIILATTDKHVENGQKLI
ncbi:MAG: hypothetical protein RLZZ546_1351 [Bacteroidota bacterium]|jgi:tRNA-binding protein